MSQRATMPVAVVSSAAELALERLPAAMLGETAWARSATRTCARDLVEAIAGERSFRIDRIIRGLATVPTIDQLEAIFTAVCDAIVANVYRQRHGDAGATLRGVSKAQAVGAGTFASLRAARAAQPAPDVAQALDQYAAVIAANDADDFAHTEACGALSETIALRLGLDDVTAARTRRAARMQHVGALGLASLRAKDGPLDRNERERVIEHPAAGARVCAQVPALADLAPIVAAHHEAYDGSGYGQGLRATDIPIEARIIAVADTFLALTNPRACRPTLDAVAATRVIEASSGTQFDPAVVVAFSGSLAPRARMQTA